MHQHKAVESRTRPYRHPVVRRKQNRAAHGNVTRIDRCECGAERHVNVNGKHRERGPWIRA